MVLGGCLGRIDLFVVDVGAASVMSLLAVMTIRQQFRTLLVKVS